MSKSKPVLLTKETDCENCPVNLRCLAGRRLNYYDEESERYNPLQAGACTFCQAVHFTFDEQRYICTNIRRGLHARQHPMYPVWDAKTANMAEIYAMGAVADDDGGNQAPPQGQTCVGPGMPATAPTWNCSLAAPTLSTSST